MSEPRLEFLIFGQNRLDKVFMNDFRYIIHEVLNFSVKFIKKIHTINFLRFSKKNEFYPKDMNKYFEGLLSLCKNNRKTSKRIRELALEMMNLNIITARNDKKVILHKLNISWHNLQIIVYRMFQERDHTKPMKAIEDFLDKRLKFINNGLNAKFHKKSGFLLEKSLKKGVTILRQI